MCLDDVRLLYDFDRWATLRVLDAALLTAAERSPGDPGVDG